MRTFTIGLVRLIHPFPVVVVVATTVILVLLFHRGTSDVDFVARAAGVILASQVAVGSLNDYVDRERDARSQPEKPIPAGLVRPRAALVVCLVGLLAFIALAATFGPLPLAIISVGTIGGLAYDLWLKPTPASFVGYLVGFLSLITWIWIIDSRFAVGYFLIYPLGALLLIAAHLAQSFPDIETDRAMDSHGLATVMGADLTFRLIVAIFAAVSISSIVLTIVARSYLALVMAIAAFLLLIPVSRFQVAVLLDRQARLRVFQLLAPGIGLLAIASLLALSSLN